MEEDALMGFLKPKLLALKNNEKNHGAFHSSVATYFIAGGSYLDGIINPACSNRTVKWMALHTIYNCTNPTALSSPAANMNLADLSEIFMREKSVTEPSNKSFTSTHALSIDILCLSTANAKYQSRHIFLSTDARKLNEAHNPEYMETSTMVPFSSPTKILINLPVFFCHMNQRPSSLPLATYSPAMKTNMDYLD
jgi:hypothetical protein